MSKKCILQLDVVKIRLRFFLPLCLLLLTLHLLGLLCSWTLATTTFHRHGKVWTTKFQSELF